MPPSPNARKRPSVHITLPRAARLLRLVRFLAEEAKSRDKILSSLSIGLRTFYRELELLNRCGVKVRSEDKLYSLHSTAEQAEGRLPFPDPQLSFAEMAELSRYPGEASQRLASLLASVVDYPVGNPKGAKRPGGRTAAKAGKSGPKK